MFTFTSWFGNAGARCLVWLAIMGTCVHLQGQNPEARADSIIRSLDLAQLANDSLRIDRMLDAALEHYDADFSVAKTILLRALDKAEADGSERDVSGVNFILGSFYAMEGEDSLSVEAFTKTLHFLQRQRDTVNMLTVTYNILNGEFEKGNDHVVLSMADSLIRVATLINRPRFVALFQEQKSSALRSLDQNRLAIEALLKSIAYFEAEEDLDRLGQAYENLALAHVSLHKYEEARQYFRQAFSYYEATEAEYFMAGTWIHLGDLFLSMGQPDSARIYFEKSFPINEANEFRLLAKGQAGMAIALGRMGRMQEAEAYFLQAKSAFQEQGMSPGLSALYVNWGKVWLDRGNDAKALEVLNEGLAQIGTGKREAEEPEFYAPLAELYARSGDWKQASAFWEKHARWLENRFATESVRQQQELMILYETEKKERELLEQQLANEELRNQSRIQALNIQRLWIGIGFLLSIGLLVFVVVRQRAIRHRMQEAQKRRELEQEIEFNQRELTTHTLHLVSKNTLLAELKAGLETMKDQGADRTTVNPLIGSIARDLKDDADWENFERYFKQVHSDFDEKIKRAFPALTGNEIRLVTLMKMNLSTKEMASILNVTPESVNKARYRLRKKINLPSDQNLQDFILAL